MEKPKGWIQAFHILATVLTPLIKNKRRVIFFDEFPWINTPRSGFMPAFENFWNTWASRQKNLVVVISGSAAAWMIRHVIRNRGGLHNRVTSKIRLLPFTLGETALFLKSRNSKLDYYQVMQLFMAMGGVPEYLRQVQSDESTAQAIDRICSTKDGYLHDEFRNLYSSLFDRPENHISVIRALAVNGKGLRRDEIINICKFSSGGGTTQILEELTESGFITPYIPFGKKVKDNIFKLTDEYSAFYLKYIERKVAGGTGSWGKFITGSSWKIWSGFAFESLCMKHITQIKRALGIAGVYSETSVWQHRSVAVEQGAQIDLLIDRQDHTISLCEMKFTDRPFEITKGYAIELKTKESVFREQTQTRKTTMLVLVTTYGVKNIGNYPGLVQGEVSMEALFKL